MKLDKEYYLQTDVVFLAKDLLGKILYTNINNKLTAGVITETEAYAGIHDKASHAYGNRRTNRTETMFQKGGIAYVYLCYGIHSLFNIVTNIENIPHAILIRGIKPLEGMDTILKRRNQKKTAKNITSGPGKVSQALGINLQHDNTDLTGDTIWIETNNLKINPVLVEITPRIGIDYAAEDALLPYRFLLKI